jgi:hypothetical protein
MTAQRQPCGEVRRRYICSFWRPSDLEQQLMLLRWQPQRFRSLLAEGEKAAQQEAELREFPVFLGGRKFSARACLTQCFAHF